MTRTRFYLPALGALLLLSACSARLEDTLECPRLDVLPETASLTRMTGGQVAFTGEIASAAGTCEYDVKQETRTGEMEAEVTATFRLARGSGLTGGVIAFDYYVALVDSHGRILNKTVFPVSALLADGESGKTVEDDPIHLTVPLRDSVTTMRAGRLYHVVVGFQLSPSELDYNRKNAAR